MLAAHAEVPPGTLPTSMLSDHDLRQCGMDPVQIRQLENELAEMGLGLGISIGGIFRGIGKGVGAVGKRAFKIGRGAVRIAAPVASFIPGPIGVAATGFTAADQFLRGPSEELIDPLAPAGIAFGDVAPRMPAGPPPMMREEGVRQFPLPGRRRGFGRIPAKWKRRLEAASRAAGPRGAARAMGYWRHSRSGQVLTGMSQVPPTREPYWKWTPTPPVGAPAIIPAMPVRPPSTAPPAGAPPTDGMSLEERIAGIVGRILPAVPQIVDTLTAPQAPTWEPPPFAPPSPVDVTVTGAGAAAPAGAMPGWLIPVGLGVAAMIFMRKAS